MTTRPTPQAAHNDPAADVPGAPRAAGHPLGAHPGFGSERPVWIFRHGEVHEDFQGRVYGGMDVPLSAGGIADTDAVIRAFASVPFDSVASSNLQRALRLGRGLAKGADAPLEVDSGLAEIQRGRWQGLSVSELFEQHEEDVGRFYADPWSWNGHGGETDHDVLERAWPVFERTVRDAAPGKPVAITCHYNVSRVLLSRCLGLSPQSSFRLRIDLSGACLVHDSAQGWQLERANVKSPGRPAES